MNQQRNFFYDFAGTGCKRSMDETGKGRRFVKKHKGERRLVTNVRRCAPKGNLQINLGALRIKPGEQGFCCTGLVHADILFALNQMLLLPPTDTVEGQDSGAIGTVIDITTTQILIDVSSGTFQDAEQIYETEDSDYVTSSSAPDSVIAVLEIHSDDGDLDDTVVVDFADADATNYWKIRCSNALSNCVESTCN